MYKFDTIIVLLAGILAVILHGIPAGAFVFLTIIVIFALLNIAEHMKKISEKGGR
jgi:hypothetical protein